jgi:hypothetical protein
MPNTMTLISSQTISSNTTTVTFLSIPQTYTDLKFVVSARSSNNAYSAAWSDTNLYFNGSNTSLSIRDLAGTGSGATSNPGTVITIRIPSSGTTSNTFGNAEVYIPNYTGSTNKSSSVDLVTENNATQSRTELQATLWSNAAAITSISIQGIDSAQFVPNSTFYLYGIVKQ